MPKEGVYFDYDLRANEEIREPFECIVCNTPLRCRWTDLHGEGVCLNCEAPYQLIQYDKDDNRIENPTPRCNIHDDYIPLLREYWEEKCRPMGLGTYLSTPDSVYRRRVALDEWFDGRM